MPESTPEISGEIFGIYTYFAVIRVRFYFRDIPQNAFLAVFFESINLSKEKGKAIVKIRSLSTDLTPNRFV